MPQWYMGSEGIAPCICNLLWLFYPLGKSPHYLLKRRLDVPMSQSECWGGLIPNCKIQLTFTNFEFSQWCHWGFWLSGMWQCILYKCFLIFWRNMLSSFSSVGSQADNFMMKCEEIPMFHFFSRMTILFWCLLFPMLSN